MEKSGEYTNEKKEKVTNANKNKAGSKVISKVIIGVIIGVAAIAANIGRMEISTWDS